MGTVSSYLFGEEVTALPDKVTPIQNEVTPIQNELVIEEKTTTREIIPLSALEQGSINLLTDGMKISGLVSDVSINLPNTEKGSLIMIVAYSRFTKETLSTNLDYQHLKAGKLDIFYKISDGIEQNVTLKSQVSDIFYYNVLIVTGVDTSNPVTCISSGDETVSGNPPIVTLDYRGESKFLLCTQSVEKTIYKDFFITPTTNPISVNCISDGDGHRILSISSANVNDGNRVTLEGNDQSTVYQMTTSYSFITLNRSSGKKSM